MLQENGPVLQTNFKFTKPTYIYKKAMAQIGRHQILGVSPKATLKSLQVRLSMLPKNCLVLQINFTCIKLTYIAIMAQIGCHQILGVTPKGTLKVKLLHVRLSMLLEQEKPISN